MIREPAAGAAPRGQPAVSPAGSRWFLGLLVAITALAPFSLQIFLPSLPAIQREFPVGGGIVQLTLSLSILANAIAALFYGPLSDRFGRRPVLLAGLGLFVVGSLACAAATTIGTLIVARIVQAIGGTSGLVLARAIVRDRYDRERSASVIAYLTMAMVVAPMLAPTLGAVLLDAASWRAIFWLVSGVGVVLTWQVATRLEETRPARAGASGGPFAGAGRLLRSRMFLAYVLQSSFGICVFFSFISGAPYVMVEVFGRSATEYGLYFILVSAAFMGGNLFAARYAGRIGLDRMVLAGSVLAATGAWLTLTLLVSGWWTPLAVFGPMMVVAVGNGFSVPNAQAGAISIDPLLAGTASGLAGSSQMFFAAIASQAVGTFQNGTPYPMAGFMAACGLLSVLSFVLLRRR